MYAVPKENAILGIFRRIVIIFLAYFTAVFFNLLLVRLSQMPRGPLWDASFQGVAFFIMLTVICALFSIPYFMKEWDPNLRIYSMYSVVFIIGYAVFDGSGVVDPAFPLKWIVAHVAAPLQEKFSQTQFRH